MRAVQALRTLADQVKKRERLKKQLIKTWREQLGARGPTWRGGSAPAGAGGVRGGSRVMAPYISLLTPLPSAGGQRGGGVQKGAAAGECRLCLKMPVDG